MIFLLLVKNLNKTKYTLLSGTILFIHIMKTWDLISHDLTAQICIPLN